ncbi:DUF975 family protein [Agathobaculum sp.]|uniref:DUF975 family protein n=1 Tax=Agathobaculum sp. TaxID=2048138 RepID=UPI002A80B3AD|nr:DUF975 family protein [Agathobaculum sp.]MDY3617598.1 DUF975 family protein [Agathobaculum sp.]
MWDRKELKRCGKQNFLRNFWAAAAVCFVLAFAGAEFADSVSFIHDFSAENMKPDAEVVVQSEAMSNWDTMLEWLRIDVADGTHPMWAAADASVKPYFDTLTGPFSSMFAFLSRSGASGVGGVLLAVLGMLGGVWLSIWVVGILQVGARRFFLESRAQDHISIAAMFTPYHRGNWWNTVKAMLLKTVYLFLWGLTLVGFAIKSYSYRMVPYILAENPQAKPREAIALSRRMMHGNKWRCFVIDLTFYLQWTLVPSLLAALLGMLIGMAAGQPLLSGSIAGGLTGLLSLFFVNGYKSATFAGLYAALRQDQLDRNAPGCELFTIPAFGGQQPEGQKPPIDDTAVHTPQSGAVFHYQHHHKFDYNRRYNVKTLILLFFAFSFAGWMWEVALHIVTQGMFINRGTMLGPWLPIYGAGGALVLILLKKLFKSPVATFFVSMVVCSVVEYFTSWYLEVTKGVRWWDYSGYFMNLNGRICLEGAVVFGLGCCAVVYFAAPLLAGLIDKLSPSAQLALCAVLVALFSADAAYSHFHPNVGRGITDYNDWQDGAKPAADAGLIAHIAPRPGAPTGTSHPC